ncbi:MAG: sodium/proton-translocating pyrophosphatase [Polyangiaceae bacterium]
MTAVVLVLSLSILGLAVAAYLLRWLVALPTGDADMNRVAGLVRDAAESFSRRQAGTLGALAALFGGALFLAYGLRTSRADPVGGLELGVWLVVSFAFGAASAIVLGQFATSVAARASIRTASAARRSIDAVLRSGTRAGALLGLAGAGLSTLTTTLLCVAVLAYHGFFGSEGPAALALAPFLPILVLGHALGASFTALLGQLSAGTFAKGADMGADLGARDVGLDDDDVDNPAAVANLAGDCVGDCAGNAMSAFAGAAIEDVAAMLALALVYTHDHSVRSPLGLLLLPLLSRTFSILGTAFGAMIVQTDDREDPSSPLLRGFAVAALVQAVGFGGVVQWILPERRIALLGGAALGLAAAVFTVVWLHITTLPRFRTVREVADSARGGATLGIVQGLGQGLSAGVWPVVALGAALGGAHALGRAYGGVAGPLLAVTGVSIGFVGSSTFLLALQGSASIVDVASGIVAMTIDDRRDVRSRLLMLDSSGTAHRASSRALAACAAVPSVFLWLETLGGEWARRASIPDASPFAARTLGALLGATAGGLLVAWLLAKSLGGVARSARRILDEGRRQQRDRALDAPANAPADAPPATPRPRPSRLSSKPEPVHRSPGGVDYGPCTEMAARHALRQMVLPGLVAVIIPIALIVGLRLLESEDKGHRAIGSVASLIVAATVAGVLGALFAAGVGGAWGNAKKYILTGAHGGRLLVDETGARAENPTFVAAVVGDTLGDPLKDVAVPTVLVLVKMLPVLALVLLPLLL